MCKLIAIAENIAAYKDFGNITYVGKGAFKEVYRIVTSSGETQALKISDEERCSVQRSEREINSLKRCNSSLIGKLYDNGRIEVDGKGYIYSLEEFLDGGSLTNKLDRGPLGREEIIHYGMTLIEAIKHLKEMDLIHRDIKPDNIMFRRGTDTPVLVDLGLVRDLADVSLTPTWVDQGPGTPYFSAPEQLNNDKNMIDWRTDQFSLGVVLGYCLTMKHPHDNGTMTTYEVVDAVATRSTCSQEYKDFIESNGLSGLEKMIEPWPIRRYPSIPDLEKWIEW